MEIARLVGSATGKVTLGELDSIVRFYTCNLGNFSDENICFRIDSNPLQ